MDIWNILGAISIICLVIFYKGPNAVWGGITIGVVVGLVAGLVYFVATDKYNWIIVKKIVIVAVLLGAIFEIFGKSRKKSNL